MSETDKHNEGQKMMFQVNRFLEQVVIAVIIFEQENNQKWRNSLYASEKNSLLRQYNYSKCLHIYDIFLLYKII